MRVTKVIDKLSAYLSVPVILTNQASPRPPYPYVGINETIQKSTANGYIKNEPLPEDINQIYITQPNMTLSVTAYGLSFEDAINLAESSHGWFGFTGRVELKKDGFVVVSVGDITNRDSLIVDDYERRRGFDVQIRFTDRMERMIEEIKRVEGTFNELPIEVEKG